MLNLAIANDNSPLGDEEKCIAMVDQLDHLCRNDQLKPDIRFDHFTLVEGEVGNFWLPTSELILDYKLRALEQIDGWGARFKSEDLVEVDNTDWVVHQCREDAIQSLLEWKFDEGVLD